MKNIKEHLEKTNKDRIDGFMKGAKEMVGFILSRFDDFSLYFFFTLYFIFIQIFL